MATILAIDPGPVRSGYVIYEDGQVLLSGILDNEGLTGMASDTCTVGHDELAIEDVDHYGMPVGKEVFETCVWIGRFIESFGRPVIRIPRREIKLALCGSARAKDGNVRQALLDRLGPKGTKASPGPTYGVSGHVWSALAVAVVAEERLRAKGAA